MRCPGGSGGQFSTMAANTLDRQFDVAADDRAELTDITSMRTMEGFADFAVVLDLYYAWCGVVDANCARIRLH